MVKRRSIHSDVRICFEKLSMSGVKSRTGNWIVDT